MFPFLALKTPIQHDIPLATVKVCECKFATVLCFNLLSPST